jgi:hypothetical protein
MKISQPAIKNAANNASIISNDQRILKLPRSGVAEITKRIKNIENSQIIV